MINLKNGSIKSRLDDDKRVIMVDGIHTLAYDIENLKNCN